MACLKINRIYNPFKIEETNATAVFKIEETNATAVFKIFESAVFCVRSNRRLFVVQREPTVFIRLERTYTGIITERKNTGAISPHER